MGRLRFVQPKEVRIDLTSDDFIVIKAELTAGEEREAFARMTRRLEAGKVAELDPAQTQLATIVAYLVGWSFTDAAGLPVEVSEDAIRSLDSETFSEIHKALERHEQALMDQKKRQATARKSSPTSTLPAA